jgi:hypothetical protein
MAARSIIFDSRYSWRDFYTAAILEPDNKRLPELIRLAEESIGFPSYCVDRLRGGRRRLAEKSKQCVESLEILKRTPV